MTEFAGLNDLDVTTVIPCLKQHITSLNGFCKKYFPGDISEYDDDEGPIQCISSAEEDQLINMSSDSTLRLRFGSQTRRVLAGCGKGVSTRWAESC